MRTEEAYQIHTNEGSERGGRNRVPNSFKMAKYGLFFLFLFFFLEKRSVFSQKGLLPK